MALLFAHLEHQVRRTAATVGRAIVEKVTGFANFDAAKYLLADTDPDDTKSCRATDTLDCLGCDWYGNCHWPNAEAEPEQKVDEPSPTFTLEEVFRLREAQYDECDRCGYTRGEHVQTWYGANVCLAFVEPKTSAVPPTAGDDPAASTSQPAAGSPTAVPAGSRCEGTSPAGLSLGEIVGAEVGEVLAHHEPSANEAGYVWCYHPECDEFDPFADWQEWREHVAPLIAERIDAASLGPAGLAANERIAAALRVAGFKTNQK